MSRHYYIYCYTNKINNHKYVGQTNNLRRRSNEHRSAAFNEKSTMYNNLFQKKIREYGIENFILTILEEGEAENDSQVNEREIFWIKELNTYCGNGQGYNMDMGGSKSPVNKYRLTPEQLDNLKQDLKKGMRYEVLSKKYDNISSAFISSINTGYYFFDPNETYPLYKYYKTDEEYDELIDLLVNSSMNMTDIAKKLNIGYSTIKKINAGTLRKGIYPDYQIRKKTGQAQKADKVKMLLQSTNLSTQKIADLSEVSLETVRRINIGETHHDENLKYPLR